MKVHPVVVVTALDQYRRRLEDQHRVVGVLMGIRTGDSFEVRQAFPIPHGENDGFNLGNNTLKEFLLCHKRIAPSEVIVGWYTTRESDTEFDKMIYDLQTHFTSIFKAQLYFQIDSFGKTDVRAFWSFNTESSDEPHFKEITVKTVTSPIAKSYLAFSSGEGTIKKSVDTLSENLNLARSALADKNVPEDVKERLIKLLEDIPSPDSTEFAKSFNKGLHDLLMVSYLSNLTRAQLAISEKLNK